MQLPTSAAQDVWLRLDLPVQEQPQTWMLRIPRLSLDKATLYQRSANNLYAWRSQSAGLDIPNTQWPVRSRDPIFNLSTRSDYTQVFFIHIQNRLPVTEDIQLIDTGDFVSGSNQAGTLNGLILGVFAILTFITLISARVFRNPHFAWLALFSLSVMLAQLTVSGYMFMRVWPESVYLAKTMGWVLPFVSLAALAQLSLSVSYARDLSKPVYRTLWALIVLCLLIVAGILAAPHHYPRLPLNAIYAAGLLVILGALAYIARRSQSWLWWIVLSLIPVVLSVLSRLAYNLAWVAQAELAMLAGVISAALGLMGIFAALAVHQHRRLLATQFENALETTDAATGLFNERIAHVRLPKMILRSKRFDQACGAILVHWHECGAVMNKHDAIQRAQVFAQLGSRLRRLSRDIDTVARVDDDKFIFLVESPITREQLNALASHILTTCMRPAALMQDHAGFQLHLALWLSSEVPADAKQVFELLGTRINHMREGTQRRVQFVDTPLTSAPHSDTADAEHGRKLVEKINALEASQGMPSIRFRSSNSDQGRG